MADTEMADTDREPGTVLPCGCRFMPAETRAVYTMPESGGVTVTGYAPTEARIDYCARHEARTCTAS